ncbi:molybdopterin molybdotransferase MoeA [Solirubrobacter ginsenosidimutans]|uniref:Molybdopterin molybdenumtransferase n=1 Tax=Solirubrobacter ginsenosidimutans TaxID=490573 RepID=A0A9X3S6D1_9ACTN|nr:gephyrin-like molybdotransferase Glp [Solirubrobacter ginsenosidimutans]MDA0165031.1 molybdopterin molybdotransferase MoeA [Solirubrobacter ginsenosidimutans]
MKDFAEALALVLEGIEPLASEQVALPEAIGRVMAAEARAAIDLPPFDRTAMDGFAVRAQDTAPGAELRVIGDLAAGGGTITLEPGTAARISTGAAIPPGADSILRVEDAEVRDGTVVAAVAVRHGLHVRRRAEDVHAGDVLARPGDVLTVPRLSALASAGVATVDVPRTPRVDVIVTGSELLPPGAPPEPGKIYESNSLAVGAMLAAVGSRLVHHPPVIDEFDATRAAIEAGLEGDILIVSGGVSVGPHDHVKPAFEACGIEEVFWRVRIKPGKPLWFGRRGSTLVFGLPGNPLSAIVCTALFVLPALRRLRGESDPGPRFDRGRLGESAGPSDNRTTFLISKLVPGEDGIPVAWPTERQGSHMTGALGESDGFAVAPHGSGSLPAGAEVDLLRV